MRIKKFFKRGARDNFVLLLTLLCEIHMVEFSRGRGTDLSHPLSSGLTHYIYYSLFEIFLNQLRHKYIVVLKALVVVSLIKSTKNLDIISVFTVNRSCTAKVCPSTDHYSCFFKLRKYFHYFRSHRYCTCNLKYSEE